jgi:hypothetical protein
VKYRHSKQYALTDQLRYLAQNKQHVGNVQARMSSHTPDSPQLSFHHDVRSVLLQNGSSVMYGSGNS